MVVVADIDVDIGIELSVSTQVVVVVTVVTEVALVALVVELVATGARTSLSHYISRKILNKSVHNNFYFKFTKFTAMHI